MRVYLYRSNLWQHIELYNYHYRGPYRAIYFSKWISLEPKRIAVALPNRKRNDPQGGISRYIGPPAKRNISKSKGWLEEEGTIDPKKESHHVIGFFYRNQV